MFWWRALAAWVVSLPLLGAFASIRPLGWLDGLGLLLWVTGFVFEAGADWQLRRFRADPANADRVLNRGLWRYSRHPNYFGECCVWWGFYLFALSAGAWWALPGPLLLTWPAAARFRGGRAGAGYRQPSAPICRLRLENERFFPCQAARLT